MNSAQPGTKVLFGTRWVSLCVTTSQIVQGLQGCFATSIRRISRRHGVISSCLEREAVCLWIGEYLNCQKWDQRWTVLVYQEQFGL